MKRNLCLLAILLALALTAGCSSGNSAYTPYSRGDYPSSATAPPAYQPPPADAAPYEGDPSWRYTPPEGTEEYNTAEESPFKDVRTSPLSTFSANADTASYSNMRRLITQGQAPRGVRVEELVNYFDYDYPAPAPGDAYPFSVSAEVGVCPWEPAHLLVMIGVQGTRPTTRVNSNIVFLLDVSGSMADANKLPLVKQSMLMLLDQLGPGDIISIVTYAGSERIVADSVPASEKNRLSRAIGGLSAGGSTAGAQALRTAYDLAARNYIEGGNNRIILATDGDFNVGESSVDDLTRLVESQRDRGVFISVLGFGADNLKDNRMDAIAAHGNGNYAYIDTAREAWKVLVREFDATLFTIARDVKFQVEFNPDAVASYRLIGYDTRRLENGDFNDDLKDAGEIGAGHCVTAFYELIPAGRAAEDTDPLKYSSQVTSGSEDYLTVKIRYKNPDGDTSRLLERAVGPDSFSSAPSEDFLFASAVAEFGLIVTESDYRGGSSLSGVWQRANAGLGRDPYGLRAEFLELVDRYGRMRN